MRKFLSFAVCLAVACSASAQKQNLEQAAKMSGKPAQLADARALLQAAMQNEETMNDARTYYLAGKLEMDNFDALFKNMTIDPSSVNTDEMGQNLIDAFDYFVKALPLDSLPDEKGKIKPKYSKDILSKLAGHHNDYANMGAKLWDSKKYYPQAYQAFMIFSEMPTMPFMGKSAPVTNPADIATFYFNAGLAAYFGNAVPQAADAFRKAQLAGYEGPEPYTYEIASWQAISQNDESRADEAKQRVMETAKAAYEKFGLDEPLFINNLINTLVTDEQYDQALTLLGEAMTTHPDSPRLYGLRGFVYDRMGNDDASEADYRKAASLPDVDFETLRSAAHKIARLGTLKWANIEGATEAQRTAIKNDYFQAALDIADKAANMNPNDDMLNNIIENIEYSLETYF